tara:strand:- start:277 stop:516 length:240 start_codon:yes stop_codon:yes gene_type:complete
MKRPEAPPAIAPVKNVEKPLPTAKPLGDPGETKSVEYGSSVKKDSQAKAQGADSLRIKLSENQQQSGADTGGVNTGEAA